jgi:uncharacterized protein (DUF2249 family)
MSAAIASAPAMTIDIRVIPLVLRHRLIFGAFERLKPGEGFIIVNNHDPRPLSRQLDERYAGTFGWQYLEQGPDVWRVRISRTG